VHRLLLLLGWCLLLQSSIFAQSNYWQQEVHYTIDVSLNDKEHALDGTLKLQYINHSPDTLHFIWFHIWPNAYKNDRTAFSDQLLENGRKDFYFSDKEQRGYINRLDFRVNNARIRTEDHPQYIDVIKVWLPQPLAPGAQTMITTPFHVQLPAVFSRSGWKDQAYQITQWYPKPAVYDKQGWHPMPYLEQGEFYSEFGSYDVRITVPEYFAVAATGNLVMGSYLPPAGAAPAPKKIEKKKFSLIMEKKPVKKPASSSFNKNKNKKAALAITNDPPPDAPVRISNAIAPTRTLQFKQDRIHDFAWFANPNFILDTDTLKLPSGRVITANVFRLSSKKELWKKGLPMLKEAVRQRSALIGEYPYDVVSVAETPMGFSGGMEYPTITNISPVSSAADLEQLIGHEVGHNWFYAVIGSNEREHPWMDEGMNTYYDLRLDKLNKKTADSNWITRRIPEDESRLFVSIITKDKLDQPITTRSEKFTPLNYAVVAYMKSGLWMQELQKTLGTALFDSCMQAYYTKWQFRHPSPQDFRKVMEETSRRNLDDLFSKLDSKGDLTPYSGRKKIKPTLFFNFRDVDKVNYINLLPAIGYNHYDKIMAGLLIHNYNPPSQKFRYLLAPLYAFGSKQFNGIGRIGYTFLPDGKLRKIEIGMGAARFSTMEGSDSNNTKLFGGYHRFTPQLRVTFGNKTPRNPVEHWIEWKTFIIGERGFNYALSSRDSMYHPYKGKTETRYINQLTYNVSNYRTLYPYDAQVQLQQGDGFYRAAATGNYFLNYSAGGGLKVRAFAAKFGYLGGHTPEKEFRTLQYQPKLTAVRGYEDYTYSNYFIGRNDQEGIGNQQIMMRDGGLKIRTDLFQDLQGRSDNWIASMNFSTTLPAKMFPIELPLRLFLDVGTYSDAWEKDAYTSRFLYVGGIQLVLLHDLINIYVPVFYSKEFRNNLKTVPEENKFLRKISFSIDIHKLNLRKLTNNYYSF
jgi:hypothetical protein